MPRFVLLRHECPPDFEKPSHWDFMLEWGGVLRTWELRELPSGWAHKLGQDSVVQSVEAIPLSDHRLSYLDFEGALSGDRGFVERCEEGTYERLDDSSHRLEIRLQGKLLRGIACLIHRGQYWLLDHTDE